MREANSKYPFPKELKAIQRLNEGPANVQEIRKIMGSIDKTYHLLGKMLMDGYQFEIEPGVYLFDGEIRLKENIEQDKTENYFAICSKCGDERYPNVNKEYWMGITVSLGKCPKCKEEKTLIPIADWEGRGD